MMQTDAAQRPAPDRPVGEQQLPREHGEGRGRRRRGRRDRQEPRTEIAAGASPRLPAEDAAIPVPVVAPPPVVLPPTPLPEAQAGLAGEPISAARHPEPREYAAASPTQVAATEESVREIIPPEVEQAADRPSPARPAPSAFVPPRLEDAGLIQIETNPEKFEAARQKVEDAPPAPRAKRVRPPLPPLSEEPLVQVETRKTDAAASPDPAELAESQHTTALTS